MAASWKMHLLGIPLPDTGLKTHGVRNYRHRLRSSRDKRRTRVPLHQGCGFTASVFRSPHGSTASRLESPQIGWTNPTSRPIFSRNSIIMLHLSRLWPGFTWEHPPHLLAHTDCPGRNRCCVRDGRGVLIIWAGASRQNQRQTERRARPRQSNSLIGLFIIKSRILCCDIIVCFIIITERFPRACGYGLMFDFICCVQHFPSKWAWGVRMCVYVYILAKD